MDYHHWVRGVMVFNVECVILTLGKLTLPFPLDGLLLDKQYAIEETSVTSIYKITPTVHKILNKNK